MLTRAVPLKERIIKAEITARTPYGGVIVTEGCKYRLLESIGDSQYRIMTQHASNIIVPKEWFFKKKDKVQVHLNTHPGLYVVLRKGAKQTRIKQIREDGTYIHPGKGSLVNNSEIVSIDEEVTVEEIED